MARRTPLRVLVVAILLAGGMTAHFLRSRDAGPRPIVAVAEETPSADSHVPEQLALEEPKEDPQRVEVDVENGSPIDPTRVTIQLFDRERNPVEAGDGWIELRSTWDSPVRFTDRAKVTFGRFDWPSQNGLKVTAEMAEIDGVPVVIDSSDDLEAGSSVKGYLVPPLLVHVVDAVTGEELRGLVVEDAAQSLFGPDTTSDPGPIAERIDSADSPFHVRMGRSKSDWVHDENIRVSADGYASDYFALSFSQAELKIELSPASRLEVRVEGFEAAPGALENVPERLSQRARERLKPHVALYRIRKEEPNHAEAVSVFEYATSMADPAAEQGIAPERAEAYRRAFKLMLAKQVQEFVLSPGETEIDASGVAVIEGLPAGSWLVTLEHKLPPTEKELDHLPSRHFWGWMGGEVLDCAFLEVEPGDAKKLTLAFERASQEAAEWTVRALDAKTQEPIALTRFNLAYRALPDIRSEPLVPERGKGGMKATFHGTPSFGWLSLVSFEAPWYAPYSRAHEMIAGKTETIVPLQRATGLLIRWLDGGDELDPSQGLDEEHYGLFEVELVPASGGDPIRANIGSGCSFFSVGEAGTFDLRFPNKPPFQERAKDTISLSEGEVVERVIDVALSASD